ncbi:unnamed protein product [Paramecium sonneborni]|uniref:EGF-like domain-containing protein n=1 Tax=Paramecium sonneborni TaxID=65129 RepID=A0A8S1R1E6_9CILI|nr:unnamed protein product [Paramecium sonneborni]
MDMLIYFQVLLMQFSIFCCNGKYIVQTDVTIQSASSQWNDLISNSQLEFCTNEKSENFIGQATNSNQIQWQRTFNIYPLTNKVYIYFEYQISGEWNDKEVELYINDVKQGSEKIQFIDTNKLCNGNFLYNSYMYLVYNQPQNSLALEIRVNQINIGLYLKNLILIQQTQRGKGEILQTMIHLPICGSDQILDHYYCKCSNALVYQSNQCVSSCGQNFLYSLNKNQCYQKQNCAACVGLNENLQCDQGYYAYMESDQDLPVCISKCPNNFYQDETTQKCLDYQQYLSTNQNSGYPIDYMYFIKNIPEFIHFLQLNDLIVQIVSEPRRSKERNFFYLDNNFYVGSYSSFQNQTIQIQTIIKNPQHKVKFRATCHFIDFYPTNFEVLINDEKQADIVLQQDVQNRIKQDKQDYIVNNEWTWQKSKEDNLVRNSIQFKVEQPQQDGEYIGYFYLEDIHIYSFQCMTGCQSCFTDTSCPPCTNPAHKNAQDCTCLQGYALQNDICIVCPTYCTTCISEGVCVDCVASTQRLNSPNCDQCPNQLFATPDVDNCQPCQIGCLKCIELANCIICLSEYFKDKSNQCVQQCSDGYYNDNTDINNPKCTQCDPNCLKCEIIGTHCTDCIPKGYLVNNHCFICLQGEYFSGTACLNCISGCQNCVSPICEQCLEGYYYMQNKNECQVICDDGYFGNYEARLCEQCDANCKTCDKSTNFDCLSCYPGNVLNLYNIISGQCKFTCLPGFYKLDDKCFKCWKGCASCIDQTQNCLVCAQNYYRLKNNGLCYSLCPDGYYNNNIGSLCSPCHPICKTCYGLLPQNCLSCNSPLAYFENECLSECQDGYGNVNNICTPCVNNCKKCFGTLQNQCLFCAQGYYYLNNQCYIKCPRFYYSIRPQYICKCQFTNCIECTENQYYFNNLCYETCPQGYFGFNNLCNLCDITCKTCFGEDAIECLSCNNSLILFKNKCIPQCLGNTYHDILTNECKYCNSECLACNGPNDNNCLVCHQNKLLTMQGYCKDECPNDQYAVISENKCYHCHSSCQTCFGSSYQNCLTCAVYFYLFECVDSCPEGFKVSKNQLQCEPDFEIVLAYCSYQCDTCWLIPRFCKSCAANRAPNPPNCDCEIGYFDDGVNSLCLKCDNKCGSCKGLANNCIKCKGDRQYPQCTCPNYYYDDGISVNCIRCQDNCQNCDSFGCTICLADRINLPNCICKDGYYDSYTYYCQQCSQRCLTCEGTANLCNTCASIRIDPPICKCPIGYFENTDIDCQACDPTCIDCNQYGCLSCFGNRIGPIFGECKCAAKGVSRYNIGSIYCTDCSVGVPYFALNEEFTGFSFDFGGAVAFIPFETQSLCQAFFQPESLLKLGTNPQCDLEFNVYFGDNPTIKVGDSLKLNREFALSGCLHKFIQIIPMPLSIPITIDKITHKPNLKFKDLNNPNICESLKIEFDSLIFNGKQPFQILSWNLVLPPPPFPILENILLNHTINHYPYLEFPPKLFQSEVTYKFSVTVESFALLQNTIDVQFQAIQKSSIIFETKSILNQFYRYQKISIPNLLQYINCVEKNPPPQILYYEIYLNNFKLLIINGSLTENLTDGYQYDVPLTFEPYFFNFNNPFLLTYSTILTRKDYTVESLSTFEFFIVPSSPIITIQGGNRMIGFTDKLQLNTTITDLDYTDQEAKQLQYECFWQCVDIVNGQLCQNQQNQLLEFNTSCSQQIKPKTFYAYTVSNFEVSIWKQNTKYSTTVSIQFIELDLPILTIYGGNSEQLYNYYDELIFTIYYPGVNPDLLMYAGAIIYDFQVQATFEFFYLQFKYKQQNHFTDLLLNQSNILKLRLSVYDPRFILPSINTQGLTMNIPPKNCSISYQSPESFVEFLDDLNISIINCQDVHNPLNYNVYLFPNRTIYHQDLINSKYHNFIILKSFQSSNKFKLNLPYYSDTECLLLFNIKDSKQGIVNLTLSINVKEFKKIDKSTFTDYQSNLISFDDQLIGYVLITERLKQIKQLKLYKQNLYQTILSLDVNQTLQANQTEPLYRSISNLLSHNVTLVSLKETLLLNQINYRITQSYSTLSHYFTIQKQSLLTSEQNLDKNDHIRLYYIFADILSSCIKYKVKKNVTSDEILHLLSKLQSQLQSISVINEPLYKMIQNSVNLNFGYVTQKQVELIIGLNSTLDQPVGDSEEANNIYQTSTNYYHFSITRYKDNPYYPTPEFPKNSSGYQAIEPKLKTPESSQNSILKQDIQFSFPKVKNLKPNTTLECISQLQNNTWTVDVCKTVKKDIEIICKCEKLNPTSVMESIDYILDKGNQIFSLNTLENFASFPFYQTIIFYFYVTITALYLGIVYWGIRVDAEMFQKIHIEQEQAKKNPDIKNTVENKLIKNKKESKYTKTGQLRDSSIEHQHALPLFKRNIFGTGLSYGAIILNRFQKPLNSPQNLQNTKQTTQDTKTDSKDINKIESLFSQSQMMQSTRIIKQGLINSQQESLKSEEISKENQLQRKLTIQDIGLRSMLIKRLITNFKAYIEFLKFFHQILQIIYKADPTKPRGLRASIVYTSCLGGIAIIFIFQQPNNLNFTIALALLTAPANKIYQIILEKSLSNKSKIVRMIGIVIMIGSAALISYILLAGLVLMNSISQSNQQSLIFIGAFLTDNIIYSPLSLLISYIIHMDIIKIPFLQSILCKILDEKTKEFLYGLTENVVRN